MIALGRLRAAALVLGLLALLQVSLWLTSGRRVLLTGVYSALVDEYVDGVVQHVPAMRRPDYFYLCPTVSTSLPPDTIAHYRDKLSLQGISLISVDDLGPDGSFPGPAATASTICLDVEFNSPVVAILTVRDGYGRYPGTDHLAKELHAFVLGRWVKLGRFGHATSL